MSLAHGEGLRCEAVVLKGLQCEAVVLKGGDGDMDGGLWVGRELVFVFGYERCLVMSFVWLQVPVKTS
jgi:hypothetical protein